jgi:hypothetical protein
MTGRPGAPIPSDFDADYRYPTGSVIVEHQLP